MALALIDCVVEERTDRYLEKLGMYEDWYDRTHDLVVENLKYDLMNYREDREEFFYEVFLESSEAPVGEVYFNDVWDAKIKRFASAPYQDRAPYNELFYISYCKVIEDEIELMED